MKNYLSSYDSSFLEKKDISDTLFFHLQKISDGSNKIKLEDIRDLYKRGLMNRNTLNVKIKQLEDIGCLTKGESEYLFQPKVIINNKKRVIINKEEGNLLLEINKPNLIKLYSYLIYLNYAEENTFSVATLISVLGYNKTGRCYKMIQSLLGTLKEANLINYDEFDNKYTLTYISHKSLIESSLFESELKLKQFCATSVVYVPLNPQFMQALSYYGESIYIWMQLNGETNNKLMRIDKEYLIGAYKEFYVRKSVFLKYINELCRLKLVSRDGDYYVIEYLKMTEGASLKISKQRAKSLFDLNIPRCVTIYSYLAYTYWLKRHSKNKPYVTLALLCRKIGFIYNEKNLSIIKHCLVQLSNMKLINLESSTISVNGAIVKILILQDVTLPSQLC